MQITNRRSQESLECTLDTKPQGSGSKLSLLAGIKEVGHVVYGEQGSDLRIRWIENSMKSTYKGVGSALIDSLKKQCQQNPRLTSVSLCCMDEDSAVFFYNKGFRFDGEGASSKNTLMDNLQQNPNFPMPDDIFLMGEMKA
ncbi:MAG: hypothetical protein VX185_04950 [Pseudomonadota bacterium]|nr:hypothetical protein [Pseudomonadota bacterium]